MNEEQAKALFFAQYLGLDIMVLPCFVSRYKNIVSKRTTELTTELLNAHKYSISYLVLRESTNLADEEYVFLAGLIGFGINDNLEDFEQEYDEWSSIRSAKQFINGELITIHAHQCNSYLLRIGVLLPFTYIHESGKPVTLQPEEIIAKGWAKIKEV